MEKYQILRVHLNEFSEGQPATQNQSKDTPAHQSPPVPPETSNTIDWFCFKSPGK